MANLNISQEEDLVFEEEEEDLSSNDLALCLVGRFLTDQTYNFNIMKSRMAAIWKPNKGVMFKNTGNGRLLIQFFHQLDLIRVLDGGPWAFDNHPLIIHRLRVGELPLQVPLNTLSFWVQIYNIPHGLFTERVGKSLGNFIGTFLEYDESNKGAAWKPYIRIKVEVDVNVPLRRWKKIKLGTDTSSQVDFKYEQLQTFCFICGKLGHTERFCDISYNSTELEIPKGWGSFLKAPNRRVPQMMGNKWLRTDAGSVKQSEDGSGEVATDSDRMRGEQSDYPGKLVVNPAILAGDVNHGGSGPFQLGEYHANK